MSEIVVALISTAGLVLVAVLNLRTNRRVKAIQGQVQNDHSTNLREELDARHDETREWFAEVRRDMGGIRSDLRGTRSELRGVRQDHRTLSGRVRIIEQNRKDTS